MKRNGARMNIYNGACAYALVGEWAQAIELLAQSVIFIPTNINGLKDDPDFRELAKQPNAEVRIRGRVEEIKKNKR